MTKKFPVRYTGGAPASFRSTASIISSPIVQLDEDHMYQLRPTSRSIITSGATENQYQESLFQRSLGSSGPLPVTVLPNFPDIDGEPSDSQILNKLREFINSGDDVYTPAFQYIIITQQNSIFAHASNRYSSRSIQLEDKRVSVRIVSMALEDKSFLPKGPYFLVDYNVYEAWRLFPDKNDAFFAPVEKDQSDETRCVLLCNKVCWFFPGALR